MAKKRRRGQGVQGPLSGNSGVDNPGECQGGDGSADLSDATSVPRGYQLVRRIKEDHGQVLFGLSINLYDERRHNLFATTGANRATVYELFPDGNIEVRQVYVDEDRSESYFCCAWSVEPNTDDALLAVAGQLGIIRIINLMEQRVTRTLMGHGNSINDLRFHPYQPTLLLSASKDESIRLWAVDSCVCVAVFTGDSGHRGEVLSLDFHLDGDRFVSAGMDNAIKVWSLKQCKAAIEKAHTFDQEMDKKKDASEKGATDKEQEGGSEGTGEKRKEVVDDIPPGGKQATGRFRSAIVQMPVYSTSRIHRNYVDCVRWHGDFILSKSTHNKVVVWKPEPCKKAGQDAALVLSELRYTCSDIWFLRFNIDPAHNFLAVGNKVGQVYVYDLTSLKSREICKLTHSQCTSTVRQTAITHDSRTILAVTEDGSIWRWDAAK